MASSSEKKIIAIIGGTGAMGRPIVATLSETNNYRLRVLTRNSQSEQAKEMKKKFPEIELVEGNSGDEQTVRKLFKSVYGVFCNTDNWGCGGYQNEIDQGKMIFNIGKELGVQHFVYSSLDHTQKLLANHGGYRCFSYDSKATVAEYIESHDPKNQTPWTIITTGPYFENFQSIFLPKKDPNDPEQLIFTLPMANKPMVMMALEDIAWFVKYSFENPEKAVGKNIYMAGDNISINDIVRIFTEGKNITASVRCELEPPVLTLVTGIKAKYNAVPLDKYLEAMPKFTTVDFDIKENFTGFFQQYLQEKVPRDLAALKKNSSWFDRLASMATENRLERRAWPRTNDWILLWKTLKKDGSWLTSIHEQVESLSK